MLHLKKLLGKDDLAAVGSLLESAEFIDGAITGRISTKNNLQIPAEDTVLARIDQLVRRALNKNPLFGAYTRPLRMLLNVNRYEVGMQYGTHNDASLMDGRDGSLMRTDVSMTVFLTGPDAYDGGELVMVAPHGDVKVKLPAGDAIVYPSSMLHRVEPITRGVRIGAFCWIQSRVRDEQKRLMIYRMELLSKKMVQAGVKTSYAQTVGNIYNNLARMWEEI